MGDRPFLSIVTRTYRRPRGLAQCCESVIEQVGATVEHIIVEDTVGMGVEESHRLLLDARPAGRYVMILDDDDLLATPWAASDIQAAAEAYRPDVIVFKMNNAELGILPDKLVWAQQPVQGHIGGCNVAVRRHVWRACIPAVLGPDDKCIYESDFRYLEEVWRHTRNIHWLDRIEVLVSRIGRGATEGEL